MSSSFKNCTHVVKTRLLEGTLSYKAIANEARLHFPDARTTDKSVASIARDMRKAGQLCTRIPVLVSEPVEEPVEEQFDMFATLEAPEFQLSLL